MTSKQLLVDISELVKKDHKTGVQRVVRAILLQLLRQPPEDFCVEPVYFCKRIYSNKKYRYARSFTTGFTGNLNAKILKSNRLRYQVGDIFFGLDLCHEVVLRQKDFYQKLRHAGVKVYFLVYDLLPILRGDYFPQGTSTRHQNWLQIVAENDGVICISKAVADEFTTWLAENAPEKLPTLKVRWFHLGADIENSVPTMGMPKNAEQVLKKLSPNMTFLMVGTIEPRKGQVQTLAAFEKIWAEENSIILAIIGKQGWMMDVFIEKLRSHPELGSRLFWLEGLSDEYMEKIYAVSDGLIMASEGEGFGLPLIEAARHRLPIIARDISVFREIAGEHAYYFSGLSAEALALSITQWINLKKMDSIPKSDNIPWLTWEQSTKQLIDALLPSHQTTENKEIIS
ncbi:MAG: glycosyltransferase family 1 protein [Legionellaceae bacterium]|nr:glycosyltransferase family 1 protein [Legionellaceae bacterium]